MGKRVKEMQAFQLQRIKKPGRYWVGRVAGLHFRYRSPTEKCWILRAKLGEKETDFGLGAYPEVSLEAARAKATNWRELIKRGIDPREEEKKIKAANLAATAQNLTFAEAAEACWQMKATEFKNAKHAEQWIRTIREYANPTLGKMYITDIQRAHVLAVLKPIWETITDTASKLRGRIETVISYAYALREITDKRNPAVWEDGLDALLPSAQTLIRKKDKHYPALPWQRMGVLMQRIAQKKGFGARALEFQIQTTSRGIEVRGARWPEIKWDKKEWEVPAERMKGHKSHRVPLTDAQLEWLRALPRMAGCDLIFPSSQGTMISDATIGKVIKDLHEADVIAAQKAGMSESEIHAAVKAGRIGFLDPIENRIASPHGTARSSFKDWVRNNLGHRFGDEVSELCLAHINSDETRAAYARDELVDLRRVMLSEYIVFIETPLVEVMPPSTAAANENPTSAEHVAA